MKEAVSLADAEVREAIRGHVARRLNLDHRLRAGDDIEVVEPDVVVAQPLVDGNGRGAAPLGQRDGQVSKRSEYEFTFIVESISEI